MIRIILFSLILLSSCAISRAGPPNEYENTDRRFECLARMRTFFDDRFSELKTSERDLKLFASEVGRALPTNYRSELEQRLIHMAPRFDSNEGIAALNHETSEAFRVASQHEFSQCGSGSAMTIGQSIYSILVKDSPQLVETLHAVGADDSYYIEALVPLIVAFHLRWPERPIPAQQFIFWIKTVNSAD
mgnify:CR=1 FL=1